MPLFVKLPGQKSGRTVTEPVGLIDILPTICGQLGIDAPEASEGLDLSRLDHNNRNASPSRRLYCESLTPTKYDANALFGVVTDRWKFIQTTRPELYDLAADPAEANRPKSLACIPIWNISSRL